MLSGTRGDEAQGDFERDVLTLDEGPVVIQRPRRLSPDSLEEFEALVQLIVRRARRSVSSASEDEGSE